MPSAANPPAVPARAGASAARDYEHLPRLVAQHAHPNEQMTYVIEGAMRFWIGSDRADDFVVRAGELLHIPSNVVHEAHVLEDTLALDVFTPVRADWLPTR